MAEFERPATCEHCGMVWAIVTALLPGSANRELVRIEPRGDSPAA
jgi:hypothetical protein